MGQSQQSNPERERQIEEIVKKCLQAWSEGNAVDEVELADAHPDLAPELAEQLWKARLIGRAADDAVAACEQTVGALGREGLRVRCPHCRNPMEVIEDSMELECESCGQSISFSDGDTDPENTPRRLGHFRLDAMLGTGAFGSVWRAHDEELDRDVAIKIPRRNQLESSQAEQFFREARIAAQLDHPNIVSVHEIGREANTVYIVSDLVQGVPLSQWMRERTLTVDESVRLCETLATALHHAHELGVVHRDLKPANIMMDGEGRPRIMDFGLAKRDVGEITMTAEGQVLGTPAYMSPEQAMGDAHRVDGRSDLYSLGVILFELLTGELPFRGSVGMLLEQVIHDEAPSPRRLTGNIPRDLETICLKCLAKDRTGRYSTSQLLAAELGRFRRGEPIVARPTSKIDRGWRWCKRNPAASLAMALTVFLAIAGPVYAVQEYSQRRELQTRLNERTKMIHERREYEGRLGDAIAEVTEAMPTEKERTAASQAFAQIAAGKYGFAVDSPSVKYLLGTGIIHAANNDARAAIDSLEAARLQLNNNLLEESSSALLLANADCCHRLSQQYRFESKPDKSIQMAKQAVSLAERVISNESSLEAHVIRMRARSSLVLAWSDLGERQMSFVMMQLRAKDRQELSSLLPDSDAEVYALAHAFFADLPPLLD